jgi:hypothetical protein
MFEIMATFLLLFLVVLFSQGKEQHQMTGDQGIEF